MLAAAAAVAAVPLVLAAPPAAATAVEIHPVSGPDGACNTAAAAAMNPSATVAAAQ